MPPVINPIFKSTPNLKTPPLCQSCQLACFKRHVPKVKQPTKAHQDQEGALSRDAYEASDFVSADQMLSTRQAVCFQVMEEKRHTLRFMVVHYVMMQLLVLSGLRIKSLLELVRL